MCDTFVKSSGSEGPSFFGKNSDRHREEVQMLLWDSGDLGPYVDDAGSPPPQYAEGPLRTLERVHPRFRHPYRALVSRPLWMWGAEMGLNERGVAIGNEAVFSRRRPGNEGLLGMDMLRLALHNAGDARQALELLASLIEEEGQGGNGAYRGRLYYDNSFLIRDCRQAFILESAGGRWAARSAVTAAISNSYRLTDDFTECDTATGQQAFRPLAGGSEERSRISFARQHRSLPHLLVTRGERRRIRAEYLLDSQGFDLRGAFSLLRDHRGGESPKRGMSSICMHPGPLQKNLTAGSMVVSYTGEEPTAWVTAAPHPCVALFQPWQPSTAETEGPVFSDYAAGAEYARSMHARARSLAASFPRWSRELRGMREDIESRCIRLVEGTVSGSALYTPDGEEAENRSEGAREGQLRECLRRAAEYWEAAGRFAGA
jgi:hypothetical protein